MLKGMALSLENRFDLELMFVVLLISVGFKEVIELIISKLLPEILL